MGTYYYGETRYDVALSSFFLAKRIFVEIQSPNSEPVQSWVDGIHRAIGNQYFDALLQNVEPYAQQIVDDALHELQ